MARRIRITLERRGVSCLAELLDADAPRTADAVWQALPQAGPVYHAKYARNEIYTFVPAFHAPLGLENPTITPIPGDVVLFDFQTGQLPGASYGYREDEAAAGADRVIDLAIFYGRNNLLLNADVGFVPGNVYATIVEDLPAMAAAANDVWRSGAAGEQLRYERAE